MPMPITNPIDFEKFLILEYFKHGSINKVFYHHHFNLPISYAGYDRLLTKYGIIKSAGPNSKLTESLKILSLMADYKLSLEKIYEKHAPHTLLTSTQTLHRVLHYVRLGLNRRQGCALIITQRDDPNLILTGNEINKPDSQLGQRGDLALPMGHSKVGESPKDSIARVLQQEVFSNLVINSMFPWELIPAHPKPLFYINIADIKVAVYHLELTATMKFSSLKLSNHRFLSLEQILNSSLRPGVAEICQNYLSPSPREGGSLIPIFNSSLNTRLYSLAQAEIRKKEPSQLL